MTRQEIITSISNKGYKVEAVEVSKNNVMFEGIRFVDTSVSPIIYTDQIISKAASAEETADTIIKLYEGNKAVNFDVGSLTKREFILDNIRIGLQRSTGEDIIKRPCDFDENIEVYMYCIVPMVGNQHGSFKVKSELLLAAGITSDEAWTQAEKNTFSETTIQNIGDILAMLGRPAMTDHCNMFVVSNRSCFKGAAAALNKDALKKLAEKFGTQQLVLIPSSIHECIVLPYAEEINIDEVTDIVLAVNGSEVDPVDQLADRAYIINI